MSLTDRLGLNPDENVIRYATPLEPGEYGETANVGSANSGPRDLGGEPVATATISIPTEETNIAIGGNKQTPPPTPPPFSIFRWKTEGCMNCHSLDGQMYHDPFVSMMRAQFELVMATVAVGATVVLVSPIVGPVVVSKLSSGLVVVRATATSLATSVETGAGALAVKAAMHYGNHPLKYEFLLELLYPDGYLGPTGGALDLGDDAARRVFTYVNDNPINLPMATEGVQESLRLLDGSSLYDSMKPLVSDLTTGKVVLGRFPDYIREATLSDSLAFNLPDDFWQSLSKQELEALNIAFLESATKRGDRIMLASPIDDLRAGSGIQLEINYLQGRGYELNQDGTEMIRKTIED